MRLSDRTGAGVLRTFETVANGGVNSRPEKRLTVKAELDTGCYPTAIPVNDETLLHWGLASESFHGE